MRRHIGVVILLVFLFIPTLFADAQTLEKRRGLSEFISAISAGLTEIREVFVYVWDGFTTKLASRFSRPEPQTAAVINTVQAQEVEVPVTPPPPEEISPRIIQIISSPSLQEELNDLQDKFVTLESFYRQTDRTYDSVDQNFEVLDSFDTLTLSGLLTGAGATFSGGVSITGILSLTATTTASKGFDLTDGCFSIDGVCVGGAGVGGSNTQLQFNDGGTLNGDTGLTYNKTSDILTLVNLISTNSTTTSATTTNFFATTASSTNLFASLLTIGGSALTVSSTGDVTAQGKSLTPGVTWTTRINAADSTWSDVVYGNGLFVAVTEATVSTAVMTSPDGITWTSRTAPNTNGWDDVTYGNGLFVAVTDNGTDRVMISPDGINWTARSAAAVNSWSSVVYGGGLFVAVSQDGSNRVMTSPDGITWTSRSAAAVNTWSSVTYGNNLFVAVSESGSGNRVMTSPDGITWTSRTSAENNIWKSVTYGNGLFVAVSSDGTNRVMTSSDGTTWIARSAAAVNQWFDVTYGEGLYIAVSFTGTGDRVMTSPDGISWTSRNSNADIQWTGVTYGNGIFVSVARSGTGNQVMTSGKAEINDVPKPYQDIIYDKASLGSAWSVRSTPVDNSWQSVTYGNGLFVAVGGAGTGNRVMTSPDSINWTLRTSAADLDWRAVTYGNGLFVAVASNGTGNGVMTSPDGITWTSRPSAVDNSWIAVTYGNGMFVATSNTGSGNRVMTSPNGITWTSRTSAVDLAWWAVTYANGLFVATAAQSSATAVMTSPDGITWTARTTPSGVSYGQVVYGNGLFVIAANSANFITSPDGITWTARAVPVTDNFTQVIYGNGLFATCGLNSSSVMTSMDGINWVSRNKLPGCGGNSRASVYSNGIMVVVNGSQIMTSGRTDSTIVSGNNIYQGTTAFTGFTGVGTTTPRWMLQVSTSTGPQLTLSDNTSFSNTHWSMRNSGGTFYLATSSPSTFATSTTAALTVGNQGGLMVGNPTGGDKGGGSINISSDIYKNNSAYTNNDYVLEMWDTGEIVQFADNPGASTYTGVMSLEEVEAYAREHYQLPRIAEAQGMFERADVVLEKLEEIFIHLFDLNKKITALSQSITSLLGIFDRAEIGTAAISRGIELIDRGSGDTYCLTIMDGEWDKWEGACSTLPHASETTFSEVEIISPQPPTPPEGSAGQDEDVIEEVPVVEEEPTPSEPADTTASSPASDGASPEPVIEEAPVEEPAPAE